MGDFPRLPVYHTNSVPSKYVKNEQQYYYKLSGHCAHSNKSLNEDFLFLDRSVEIGYRIGSFSHYIDMSLRHYRSEYKFN